METLPAPPGFATGQTLPQGGSRGAALGGPKKPRPAVMRWISPRRSGQSWQENLQNHRERKKANDGPENIRIGVNLLRRVSDGNSGAFCVVRSDNNRR